MTADHLSRSLDADPSEQGYAPLSEDPKPTAAAGDERPRTVQPHGSSDTVNRDWSFLWRPRWIASHIFAVSLCISFIFLGFWQLDRLDQRQARNEAISSRSEAAPLSVADALNQIGPTAYADYDAAGRVVDYAAMVDTGRYIESDLVRVANRSQAGASGEWTVGAFETDDGHIVLVLRGFSPRDIEVTEATDTELHGWFRRSQIREGSLGAVDRGESTRVPRLDVEAVASRLDPALQDRVIPVWVQLGAPEFPIAPVPAGQAVTPIPVPLPELDEGSHLSYAFQWFTFCVMGLGVYAMVLRRKAAGISDATPS